MFNFIDNTISHIKHMQHTYIKERRKNNVYEKKLYIFIYFENFKRFNKITKMLKLFTN